MNRLDRRRAFLSTALLTPLVSGCFASESFDMGWEEEVQLHDGETLLVHLVYTYQRLDRRPVGGRAILRKTKLSFDAGTQLGTFTRVFEKHRVDILDRFNGDWYLLLETRGAALTSNTADGWKEEWGSAENGSGQKCLRLSAVGLTRASINDLPDEVLKVNLLMDYAEVTELAKFNGTRVTLSQKRDYEVRYPLDPNRRTIRRPPVGLAPK